MGIRTFVASLAPASKARCYFVIAEGDCSMVLIFSSVQNRNRDKPKRRGEDFGWDAGKGQSFLKYAYIGLFADPLLARPGFIVWR